MLAYVTVGTNDLPRAAAFFDAVLGELGAVRTMEYERMVIWSAGAGQPMIGAIKPYDGEPSTAGNGAMVAIPGGSRENVDRLHAKAIELGATDEGPPGERMPVFYGAYVRDLDGNKLCFFDMKLG